MFLNQLILSFLLWIAVPMDSPAMEKSIDPVVLAIDSGSSSELARYFDSSISLNINGQQGDYSRSQAELVVKDFFKKNPPMSFSLVFKSENNPSTSSYIGEYSSGSGSFKVFIKANHNASEMRVYSLEFVKA